MNKRLLYPLIVLVAVILGGAMLVAQDARAQQSWVELRNDVRVIGRIVATGDMLLDGNLNVRGIVTSLPISTSTIYTVATDGNIDCSNGGIQRVATAGNITTDNVLTTTTAGVTCYIYGVSAHNIVITDTNWNRLSGNATVTQYDVLELMTVDNSGYWHQMNAVEAN